MSAIHNAIADALPPLSHLQCDACAARRDITRTDAAGYLAHGWPECCGHTMRLVTHHEAPRGSEARR